MRALKVLIVTVVCLWLAAGCEQTLSPRVSLLGATPDFILATVVCISMLISRSGGALVGFAGGVIHGAILGANLTWYAISRTLSGYLVGWFMGFELEKSPFLAFIVAAVATVFAQLVLMFMAPPPAIIPFLLATIGSAMYTGVLAMPFYALLQRILGPTQRS